MPRSPKTPRKLCRNACRSKRGGPIRFISFITSEACEKCKNEKRKTINGEDLLYAINTLGFEIYVDILKLYLNKYREVEELKYVKAVKATEGTNTTTKSKRERHEDDDDDDEDEDDDEEDEDNESDHS